MRLQRELGERRVLASGHVADDDKGGALHPLGFNELRQAGEGTTQHAHAGASGVLDHRHRHLAELLGQLRIVLQQLQQPDRARQAGLAAADDRDADLDPLVLLEQAADTLEANRATLIGLAVREAGKSLPKCRRRGA